MVRVVVFTDEPIIAEGWTALLSGETGLEVVAVCGQAEKLPDALAAADPDLLLLDFQGGQAGEVLISALKAVPKCRTVLWVRSMHTELAYQAIELGVRGILRTTTSPEDLVHALKQVAAGEVCVDDAFAAGFPVLETVELTSRESQLVTLVARGMTNREVAEALSITEGTVKVYLSRLFHKAGVRDRHQLALYGIRNMGVPANYRARQSHVHDTYWPRSLALVKNMED